MIWFSRLSPTGEYPKCYYLYILLQMFKDSQRMFRSVTIVKSRCNCYNKPMFDRKRSRMVTAFKQVLLLCYILSFQIVCWLLLWSSQGITANGPKYYDMRTEFVTTQKLSLSLYIPGNIAHEQSLSLYKIWIYIRSGVVTFYEVSFLVLMNLGNAA